MNGFDVALAVERGGFRLDAAFTSDAGITVVVGPSGSGKSSLLLAILGALAPHEGRVVVAGTTVFDSARGIARPIRERRIGMVFQDALLFPHMTVRGNVAFAAAAPHADRPGNVEALLEQVGASELAEREPATLSGGQRQRVALARALAADPLAVLLDEPFSALDVGGRDALGQLLLDLQASTGIPFLHVTHDLGEAVRLGGRLVLLDEGRVVQTGPPAEVIAHPTSIGAARAVGTENRFSGRVVEQLPGDGMTAIDIDDTRILTTPVDLVPGAALALGLRAEDVLLSLEPLAQTSARNVIEGRIEDIATRGAGVEVRVCTPTSFRVIVTPATVRDLRLESGKTVWLLIKASAFHRLV